MASKDVVVRCGSAYALREMGPTAGKAVPALIQALGDRDEAVCEEAGEALAHVGPGALPELLKAAKDNRARVRAGVARVLGQFRSEGKKVVAALAEALEDKNVLVHQQAAAALIMVGPEAKRAIPALIAALQDKEAGGNPRSGSVSGCALGALATLGPAAKDAIPAVIELIKSSKDRGSRVYAVYTLGKIGRQEKKVIPVLVGLLKDSKEFLLVRANAARALGDSGPKADIAVPALIDALKLTDEKEPGKAEAVRASAAWALGQIGTQHKITIPALLAILENKDLGDAQDRRAAAQALGNMGPAAKVAIPALAEALKNQNTSLHQVAAQALKKIQP